jgi:hypothetical protein
VQNDAVTSIGELMIEGDLWIVENFGSEWEPQDQIVCRATVSENEIGARDLCEGSL